MSSSTINVKLLSADSAFPDLQLQSTKTNSPAILFIGRNSESKIKSTRCSKNQVCIHIRDGQVSIQQLGSNTSYVNGTPIVVDGKQPLNEGDTLHLLENEHIYTVQIEGTVSDTESSKTRSSTVLTLKRQHTEDMDTQITPKKQKANEIQRENEDKGALDDLDPLSPSNFNDSFEENRAVWIQQQLDAMQARPNVNQPSTIKKPAIKLDPTGDNLWEKPDTGLEVFTSKGVISSEKIAAFDMDGTLIVPKSGRVHPVDENDWRIAFDSSFKKLKQLRDDHFKLVIFTNQRGLMKATSTDNFRKKIEYIQQKLAVPLQVFVGIHPGRYRKPCIGSWSLLQSKYNDGIEIDKSKSFYVGDAAGRPDKWRLKAKKDHSCADRLFADNLGLRFYTPEEYFLGLSKASYNMPKFEPKSLRSIQSLLEPATAVMKSNQTEMIVMCGLPASGKSWFVSKYIRPHNYEYISRDELGTRERCLKMTESALTKGQSVVIDNTNIDKESRYYYIKVAKAHKIPCRCFMMNVTVDHAKHNNLFRQILGADAAHKDVNEIVILAANKRFEKPTIDEGFSEIVLVNIQPLFDNDDMEKLYYQYILDK